MVKALDAAPAAGMAFGAVEPFGNDPDILRHEVRYFSSGRQIARRLSGPRELGARLVFLPPIFVNSACMARRTAFALVGGYDGEIPVCEDADLWGRIANSTGYVFVDRPVVRYRTGESSLMHNLAAGDARLHLSYRRIQEKYRRAHGLLNFLVMKFWARAIWRLTDSASTALIRASE
jgi:GT2 family glycosyltransferase